MMFYYSFCLHFNLEVTFQITFWHDLRCIVNKQLLEMRIHCNIQRVINSLNRCQDWLTFVKILLLDKAKERLWSLAIVQYINNVYWTHSYAHLNVNTTSSRVPDLVVTRYRPLNSERHVKIPHYTVRMHDLSIELYSDQ